jgi:hypothetical protein
MYHYDMKLMIYVLFWITLRYKRGMETFNALQHWVYDTSKKLNHVKQSFFNGSATDTHSNLIL